MAPKRTRKRPEDHPDLVEPAAWNAEAEPDGTITVDAGMEAEREHLERFFGKAKRPATKKPAQRRARPGARP
jgi:hypothetical protein